MKKKMVALFAALMVLSMTTPAFAAPSVEATDVAKPVTSTKAVAVVNGQEVELTVKEVEADTLKTVYDKVNAAAADSASSTDKHSVLAVFDVSLPAGVKMPAGGIEITFDVDGVVAGDKVYLFHEKNDGTWETITPSKVADGKVIAKFTSLSPVAIVKVADSATSPKTGVPVVAPLAALVCAAGAVGCARKMR